MVTKSQYEILKKYLKGEYVKEVQKVLIQKNIKSRNGKNYGDSIIRNVLNGTNKNHKIKKALLQVYMERKEKAEEFNDLLKNGSCKKSNASF